MTDSLKQGAWIACTAMLLGLVAGAIITQKFYVGPTNSSAIGNTVAAYQQGAAAAQMETTRAIAEGIFTEIQTKGEIVVSNNKNEQMVLVKKQEASIEEK